MPFKYSCFISYRVPQRTLMQTFIREFHDTLQSHLEPYFDLDVFIDQKRLQGGDFYNEMLARELSCSVCMILVYTPKYFDKIKTFCTREFKLMQQIEQQRLGLFQDNKFQAQGLIIPVVFREPDFLPPALKHHRHHYDFSMYRLSHSPMSTKAQYEDKFERIARYIYERYQQFEALDADPCVGCDRMCLPTHDDVQDYLRTIIQPFPGR